MRKDNVLFLIIASIVLLVLIVFVPSYGWTLRAWLSPKMPTAASSSVSALQAQNQALEAQLAELQSIQSELPAAPTGTIRAMAYSTYPLNFKNEMLVNAGANDGVAVGDAATFQGIFVGTVTKVFPSSAVVDTVFDSNFKMAVRIGASGADALFEGGADPVAASIAKSAAIMQGDVVYTAASGTPYALPIATVAATSTSADSLFQQASLSFAYDVNDVQTVLITQ